MTSQKRVLGRFGKTWQETGRGAKLVSVKVFFNDLNTLITRSHAET